MLTKSVNPALATTNGINTDLEISNPGFDTAVVKFASKAGEGRYWVLDSVQYSYKTLSGPVEGELVVKDGNKVVLDLDISDFVGSFNLFLPASPGNDLEVLLRSGGEDVVGKLNVQTHVEASA